MSVRDIVRIDQEKCDGCGQCVGACAEGAIQIVDGKARLVKEIYCDGLGACLGRCPRDAISIEKREAPEFDEGATRVYLASLGRRDEAPLAPAHDHGHRGCPGMQLRHMPRPARTPAASALDHGPAGDEARSRLQNWPVQFTLVPPGAPWLAGADILLAADCVPFALAGFHGRLLEGRVLLIGCPKLDDAQSYVEKLAQILRVSRPRSLTVVHMEVPCCTGLSRIADAAIQISGSQTALRDLTVTIGGELIDDEEPALAANDSF
ncbi:MAG: 4Fe-4S binding protein [Candidatus Riflebacteria bacterium]|nr:4Fe-4S binding protein [Candidatus Riflebacteria bacterium]